MCVEDGSCLIRLGVFCLIVSRYVLATLSFEVFQQSRMLDCTWSWVFSYDVDLTDYWEFIYVCNYVSMFNKVGVCKSVFFYYLYFIFLQYKICSWIAMIFCAQSLANMKNMENDLKQISMAMMLVHFISFSFSFQFK